MSVPFDSPSPLLRRTAALDIASVWRASELSGESLHTLDTGYPALNRELPGGGWPQGAMVEVLQPQAGQHEWGLLAPVLASLQAGGSPARGAKVWLALVGAPSSPFGPALRARHISMQRLLCIAPQPEPGIAPALLWATREALQCADVAAVLAWLPEARSAHLRRLQIAAQTHNKLLFVFRPLQAQQDSSPAPLRLRLKGAAQTEAGHNLQIDVFKRRGPLLASPVLIDTRPARLAGLLAASLERSHQHEVNSPTALFDMSGILRKPLHAMDRSASLQH